MTDNAQVDGSDFEYLVRTDLAPEFVTQVGLEIFKQWADFAAGIGDADGKRLVHPTGRYESSISFAQTGVATVAIVADPAISPAAAVLETGHGIVDLKEKKGFPQGRIFHSAMWAYPSAKYGAFGGPDFATVGAAGWVIPPMPAYSPAKVFAYTAARMARGY
jgi:hypothetical protein